MDINFNKNEDHNKLLLSNLKHRFAKIKLGGGEKRIEKLHAEGKMTARERIDYLLDTKANSIEIGAFVGDGMYSEHGGCPSGGVIVKMGYINGKQCPGEFGFIDQVEITALGGILAEEFFFLII